MYRVAAVFESFAQSKGMTSQSISARPNLAAVCRTASLDSPPAGRYKVGVRPVAAVIASLALENWAAMSSGGIVAMFGCSHVWLPISIPASAIRLAPAGLAATLLPIRKKVAFASSSFRICSSRSSNGPGPSSNVSATHLTTEQLRLSARVT